MNQDKTQNQNIHFPAEWENQSFVQLTWPHEDTDWKEYLHEANECFKHIACEIAKRQKLLIVCKNKNVVKPFIRDCNKDNIVVAEIDNNDTWARDHGGITVYKEGKPVVYNFTFNGWGQKFPSNLDNQITPLLFEKKIIQDCSLQNYTQYVLEGGSLESNGKGVLLTTAECLLSKNRNEHLSKAEVESMLKEKFGLHTVLWLNHGYLAGDDTDSHVDTLARFISEDTIMYVSCSDQRDEHYEELSRMETELMLFRTPSRNPYKLVKLPMVPPVYDDENNRIPGTYANFLFINGAVLVPVYNHPTDMLAIEIFKNAIPDREIIPINCSVLIKQHGSLHCVTMQYPEGVEI